MTEGLDELDVRAMLTKACRDAGGITKWAQERGISRSYVCDVTNAKREIGPTILAALGLQKVVRYVSVQPRPTEAAEGSPDA